MDEDYSYEASYETEKIGEKGRFTYHNNLDQSIIRITEDKVRLVLIEYENNGHDKKGWITPLGFLITFIMVPITTSYKDVFDIKAETWAAIFIILTIGSGVWLIWSIWKAMSKKMTLDDVINKLKNSSGP